MSEGLKIWRPAEEWGGSEGGMIDVWWCELRGSHDRLAAKHALLTPVEQARAARFRHATDRAAYVVVRATLRERLAACLGLCATAVPLAEGAHAKPVLAMPEPRWEFNVSHSGDIGLVALAWNRAVGVDVEAHRAKIDGPEMASQYFSPRECAVLECAPADERLRGSSRSGRARRLFLRPPVRD